MFDWQAIVFLECRRDIIFQYFKHMSFIAPLWTLHHLISLKH